MSNGIDERQSVFLSEGQQFFVEGKHLWKYRLLFVIDDNVIA